MRKNEGMGENAAARRPRHCDVAVIGAGASGLCAAYAAASRGARTILLEALEAPGKKLLATGNGRCNMSNLGLSARDFRGGAAQFTDAVLRLWTTRQMRRFWERLGLATREEEDRIYPYSLQAKSLHSVLLATVAQSGCQLLSGARCLGVDRIPDLSLNGEEARDAQFLLRCADGRHITARKVILCAGGAAAPALGSTGEAYALYQAHGHRLIKPRPALVQLTSARVPKRLAGTRCRVRIALIREQAPCFSERGELLFTDYGLSGICVLNLSEYVNALLEAEGQASVSIDFLPELAEDEALALLLALARHEPQTPAAFWGIGLLPEKLSPIIYEQLFSDLARMRGQRSLHAQESLDGERLGQLSEEQLRRLVRHSKDWRLRIDGNKGFGFAQVTAGGLDCAQFNPYTMESLLQRGLYAAGEVLDVHGPCGGYNLHWAFASGSTAGQQAALSLMGGAV